MATRRIIFDGPSLLHVLVHYLMDHQDRIPLDCELVGCGVSPYINRWIGLDVASDDWSDEIPILPGTQEPAPLQVRYEGRRTMSWGDKGPAGELEWRESVGSPNQ